MSQKLSHVEKVKFDFAVYFWFFPSVLILRSSVGRPVIGLVVYLPFIYFARFFDQYLH